MTTPEQLQGYIQNGMQCDHVAVTGDGAHFEAVIVSPLFQIGRAHV